MDYDKQKLTELIENLDIDKLSNDIDNCNSVTDILIEYQKEDKDGR